MIPLPTPRLARRTATSFDCNDIEGLAAWLRSHTFTDLPPRYITEAYRLMRADGAIVVISHSAALACQGSQAAHAAQLLAELVTRQPAEQGELAL